MKIKCFLVFMMLLSVIVSMSSCSNTDDIIIKFNSEGTYSKDTVVRGAELIIRGTVSRKTADYTTNPEGSKTYDGFEVQNYPVRKYDVNIGEVYYGEMNEESLEVKLVGAIVSDNTYISDENGALIEEDPESYFWLEEGKEYIFFLRHQPDEEAARFGDEGGWRFVLGNVGAFEKQDDGTFANLKEGNNHFVFDETELKSKIQEIRG